MSQTSIPNVMARGFPGLIADLFPDGIESLVQAEASAAIAFGWAVKLGLVNSDRDALKIASDADTIRGIVVHSHTYSKGGNVPQLDAVGVLPKNMLSVMRHGRIWVLSDSTVNHGVRGYYNVSTNRWAKAGGAGFIDCTGQVTFLDTATGVGNLVRIEVDFRNKP